MVNDEQVGNTPPSFALFFAQEYLEERWSDLSGKQKGLVLIAPPMLDMLALASLLRLVAKGKVKIGAGGGAGSASAASTAAARAAQRSASNGGKRTMTTFAHLAFQPPTRPASRVAASAATAATAEGFTARSTVPTSVMAAVRGWR